MNDCELASRAGTRFGPYQLVQLLGRGGMGEVYQAEDTRKHRVVALKLISPQFSNNSVFRARMQREADTAGRLTEPHIVPIHDYGEIDGQFFVEMRLIDGASLRSLLKHYGPLNPARTVAIVRQIAAALDAAHSNGVTHRDVKPENILIGGNDFAYLVDFGIARAATDPGLTQSRDRDGHLQLHGPGAVHRRRGHLPRRYLRAGLCVGRVLDRGAAVPVRQCRTADRRASARARPAAQPAAAPRDDSGRPWIR